MTPFRLALAALAALACASPGRADPVKRQRYRGADEIAARIDRHLADAQAKADVRPTRLADDGEWLRRVYLDLAGRIPSVTEARTFLADKNADKRARVVEKLLDGPRYATHFARVWRNLLLPEAASNLQLRFFAGSFEQWLRNWTASERGYDWMARELTSATVAGEGNFGLGNGSPSVAPFFFAKEYKPEEIASAVSRVFLGVNIGCAQCHNHPFASWTRDQFWGTAAFFSGIESNKIMDIAVPAGDKLDRHEIAIPNTERKIKAKYLDGKAPTFAKGDKVRLAFAEWMTTKNNPYFARAGANRMWSHFFGLGLMEPIDEMAGNENTTGHVAALDDLSKAFAERDFDVRFLIRAITATRAYNLSSARTDARQDDPTLFAKAPMRSLTGEQLYDSIARATGHREAGGGPNFGFGGQSVREDFLSKFSSTERQTDAQTSILQALNFMNGKLTASATKLEGSETLAAIADAPFLSTKGRVEALYLAALARKPTTRESARLTAYVDKGGASKSGDLERRKREALADVFWALLNSGEFYLNH